MRICLVLLILLVWTKMAVSEFAADIHRKNGDTATAQKDWKKAIYEYNKAHKLSPIHGRICYDMGMAYVRLKDYDNAIKAFLESIKIRHYGEVYNDLANCYYLKNMKEEAIKNWEIAVDLGLPNPEDQEKVRRNLAILRSHM